MAATVVTTRLRRSMRTHQAYTVRVANRRVAALVTAHRGYARRWVSTTRWLNRRHIRSGRLVVGLGVQWTPTRRPLHGAPPRPATLQLCVGHRCLVFHLARADAVPSALRRFLAHPRITFVGSGSRYDRVMLSAHYGLQVASGRELRAAAGMGNASMESMADRFLGYSGIKKTANVAMSAWHAPQLSPEQVEYACVDAYLAFRLGVHLCPGGREPQRAPILLGARAPPPAQHPSQHRYVFLVSAVPGAVTGSSYMETETEYDGETGNLSVAHPSYGSDDDGSSWDKLERIGYGAVTDDEDSEDSYADYAVGHRTLGDGDSEEDGYDECTEVEVLREDDEEFF